MNAQKKVHLIGIGGIGMSGIARMYLSAGYWVQGSDAKKNEITDALEGLGVRVWIGDKAGAVDDADLVVYSSSIPAKHPERQAAEQNGIRVIHRAQALAEICRGKYLIAVTGTHGKTTTTALVGMILKEAGRDPSIVVGGLVNFFGGNACYGRGPEVVIEADESDSSFLRFSPDLELITNIEEDHMDHFKTAERVVAAYRDFIGQLAPQGEWFGCSEDPRVCGLAKEGVRDVTLYGFDRRKSKIHAACVRPREDGVRGMSFVAFRADEELGEVRLKILGRHNVLNALGAVGVGLRLGIPFAVIRLALEKYEGAGRRFDVKFESRDFLIVDDYAHHPTEIKETLSAARGLNKKRIVALFQPHRYTRTEVLLDAFGKSFFEADKLIVTDIYAASESPRAGITGERVRDAVRSAGHPDVTFIERLRVSDFVLSELQPGDLVIALGAGDIGQVAGELSDILRKGKLQIKRTGAPETIFNNVRGKICVKEPLSKHTSLKVGGPVNFWIEPADDEDLRNVLRICRDNQFRIYVFGGGSNVLAPDQGLEGTAIHLGASYFHRISLRNDRIVAGGGVPNAVFIQYALTHGFGGCEFLSGIPGSIGGSIAMNAGSHHQSIGTFVENITLMGWEGDTQVIQGKDADFSYRRSGLGQGIITEAEFALPSCDRKVSQERLEEYRLYRSSTQDLQHASAGCMFKNPLDSTRSAGQWIEDAGLKGRTIGRAQISMKHANFIINLGGAAARDVLSLIDEAQRTVQLKFGVKLETEVKLL